jgi:hypothetical protein
MHPQMKTEIWRSHVRVDCNNILAERSERAGNICNKGGLPDAALSADYTDYASHVNN